MPQVYILRSELLDRFYIGSTSDSIDGRLSKHDSKFYGNKAFTAKAKDWVLYWSLETPTLSHAQRIEKKIKLMKSKIYIKNLTIYPELSAKLLEDTKSWFSQVHPESFRGWWAHFT